MDTFIIDVNGTAEATWQGSVKADGQKVCFLSTLEMLKAIDNALESGALLPDGNGKFRPAE